MQEDHISFFLEVGLDLAEAPIYQDVENSRSQSFVFCTRALDPWATCGNPVAPYSSPSRLLSQALVLHRWGKGAAAPGLLGGVLLRGFNSAFLLKPCSELFCLRVAFLSLVLSLASHDLDPLEP